MHLNLHAKFLISLITLVVLSLASMGFVLLRDADQRLAKFQLLQARSQAHTLAESSKEALLEDDFPLLENLVNVAISEEYYAYAAIVDPSGMIITHTDLDYIGRNITIDEQENVIRSRELVEQGQTIREISYPIILQDERLGTAKVAYYVDTQVGSAQETITWIVNILLFTLVSMALGSLFITRRLTKPISELTDTVYENFPDHRLTIAKDVLDRSDEVGSLARAFKSMSDQLVDRFEELQHQIEERDLAKAESEIKTAFLANVSHELRTPLNAIIGYSELLMESYTKEELCKYKSDIEKIIYSAKHLTSLINDMLDLSKIEAGKVAIHYEYFNIRSIIDEIEATVFPLVSKNNNRLVTQYTLHEEYLNSDPLRIKQVLINLISNAAKFTTNGKISIDILINDHVAEFKITDTGIGMSSDQIEIIFDPFAQAELNTTKNYGGTGLGLAISRRICHMLGGEVSVVSAVGKGSTFTVSLPIQTAAKAVSAK